MAAARANSLTPAQIAGYLDDRFRLLKTDPGATHGRHASLTAAFDWSYDLLSADCQMLFDQLSVFAGPFDLAAVEAVTAGIDLPAESTVKGLGALVDASMVAVVRADGSIRYRLLDTLRLYGRDRLDTRAATSAAAARHSRYFLSLAEASGRARMTPEHPATLAALEMANDDLLAALEWSLDNEERSVTLVAAPGLAQYWVRRGDPAAALRYGNRMLEGAAQTSPRLRADARTCVAFGALMMGDVETALSALNDVMQLLHGDEDWKTLLWVLNVQGTTALFAGKPAAAIEVGSTILELCADHDVTLPRAYGLSLMGQGEFFSDGDLAVARSYFEEAVALFRMLGDESALNISGLAFLSGIVGLQGDYVAAERFAVEATTLGGPGWSAAALVLLAAHALQPAGELDRAERALVRGLMMSHERSMEIWTRTALLILGRVAADREEW
jgi:tetratricopeptide (TPR) repeat protein